MGDRDPPTQGDGVPNPSGSTVAVVARGEEVDWQSARLVMVNGPQAGRSSTLDAQRGSIGSDPLNSLVIDDPTVSRFHCEIALEPDGAWVVDLRSKNGTLVDGLAVREARLRHGSVLKLGRAEVRFEIVAEAARVALPQVNRFGSLVGAGKSMRATLALLARASGGDTTVLLEGETGTGKGQAAEAMHRAGARADQPFIVVDCGGIPENLIESELFGHEKGAFTGADRRRIGAFEEASGGTVFLDEIGELPLAVQPKLLRALENREVRRLGTNRYLPVDVRLIAATHRDLRADVNAGRFRADLFFRLAVVRIRIPPLRERPEDLPALAAALLDQLDAPAAARDQVLAPRFLEELARHSWSGNVRELRNHIERFMLFAGAVPDEASAVVAPRPPEEIVPFAEARRVAQAGFERTYLEGLLARYPRVAEAAQAARIDRVYLYRLMRRHGIKAGS